jgi:hypothetical protein
LPSKPLSWIEHRASRRSPSFFSKNLVLRPIFLKPFEYQAFPFSPEQSVQHGRNTAVLFSFANSLALPPSKPAAPRVGFKTRCPEGMPEKRNPPTPLMVRVTRTAGWWLARVRPRSASWRGWKSPPTNAGFRRAPGTPDIDRNDSLRFNAW